MNAHSHPSPEKKKCVCGGGWGWRDKRSIAGNVTESSRSQCCLGFFDAGNLDAFPAGMFFSHIVL